MIMSHSDPGRHLASLQAVAREEASQVCLLPEAVYLCTEATAATLRQTHTSGMQVSGLVVEQVFKMWVHTIGLVNSVFRFLMTT